MLKIQLSKHAAQRARQRCFSEYILNDMFYRALRDAERGVAEQHPSAYNPRALVTFWKDWVFVHEVRHFVNPRTGLKLDTVAYLATFYSKTSWHLSQGRMRPKTKEEINICNLAVGG